MDRKEAGGISVLRLESSEALFMPSDTLRCALTCALLRKRGFFMGTCQSMAAFFASISSCGGEEVHVQRLVSICREAAKFYWHLLKRVRPSMELACGHTAGEHFKTLTDFFFTWEISANNVDA